MKAKIPANPQVHLLAQALLRLRKIQDQVNYEFLKSLGTWGILDLDILNIIGDNEPCTMSFIAKKRSLSFSSITMIVDKLVKAGLVKRTRSAKDRRIVFGSLTLAGKKLYQIQIEQLYSTLNELLEHLSTSEQKALIKIMQKMTSFEVK